jgi:low temperature requirement protein LtrA
MTDHSADRRDQAAVTGGSPADAAGDPVERVTPLELFFDLVFVFTITQLSSLLTEGLTWSSLWHVVVMLGLIYWMYDGYAWLTNAVAAEGARRQALLLVGMAGYLVLAIAIPDAFTGTGLTFGIAYLAIIAVHASLYVASASESSSAAMRALAPVNLAAAVAVLVAGALGGVAQELVWTTVALLLWFATRAGEGFEIGPAHFVERHGLLVLIAIGESVVATGMGAQHLTIDYRLVTSAVLGLLLSAGLWWTYFGEGVEPVERAFRAATGGRRVRLAFVGFGYAHYLMLLGVVLAAVGLRIAVAHPGAPLSTGRALILAGGSALFVVADGWFRSLMGIRRWHWRGLAGLIIMLAVPVGTQVSATAALAATVALLVAAVALERRTAAPL